MNETNNIKLCLIEYIEEMLGKAIRAYVGGELARIENTKQESLKLLNEKLQEEAEKIATKLAIEVQLWKKVDAISGQLNIQIIKK